MNEPMKLIEGMKKLKVMEKHLDRNSERIQQYASAPSNEKPAFDNDKDQRAQVKSLIQSNTDLVAEYLHLKQRVEMTNLTTTVTIGARTLKLNDLLVLRRGLGKKYEVTFRALNTTYAEQRINQSGRFGGTAPVEKAPQVVRFYDENEKYEKLQEWQSIMDEIEQRLEVINATTDLVTID